MELLIKILWENKPHCCKAWKAAVADDDIDITERYGSSGGYYLGHYTNQGKAAGNRGNAAKKLPLPILFEKPLIKILKTSVHFSLV